MFDGIREKLRQSQAASERAKAERERAEQAQRVQQERDRMAAEDRERRVRSIRIIPGDVKYRYVVLDTVRTVGYAEFGGNQMIDPDAATRQGLEQLQDLAFSMGADAIIHAQFQVMRYTVQGRQMQYIPVYETHIFGTAIRVVGPPEDWSAAGG